MPRAGLNSDAVVDVALALVDEKGPEALSLAAVADRAGVAAPSLYKHIGSLADLRDLMAVKILHAMARVSASAALGRSRDDAVAALMRAYRDFVLAHPGWYTLVPLDPLRHGPAPMAEAARDLLEVFFAVLRGYGLTDAAATHATRRVRAAVHGFAVLQAGGGFGLAEDVEETYDQLIAMVTASLPH
ncbi:TetR/AcrR family transcriptional regulator [Nucisporomicrobium flavum]|uniref:TetR/AcrR family transcriptional regulator n=1 Tax=Nucisporomicrobium flavum TaxID=2785915 RepID=UPI0018F43A6D|nr:TetR/AcrR family transcriptional regulator [Nucisporomicrobium flavum]